MKDKLLKIIDESINNGFEIKIINNENMILENDKNDHFYDIEISNNDIEFYMSFQKYVVNNESNHIDFIDSFNINTSLDLRSILSDSKLLSFIQFLNSFLDIDMIENLDEIKKLRNRKK